MQKIKKEFLSIPNILCYVRILLIPVFIYLYIHEEEYTLAAIIAALSGVTDMLDGFIARKFNMITDFGKFIDPVADKLTQMTLILCLLLRYNAMWVLVPIFFVKETAMAVAGFVTMAYKGKKLNGAKWYGKVSTIVQFISMTALLAFPNINPYIVNGLILLCAIFMLLAFILYMADYRKMLK